MDKEYIKRFCWPDCTVCHYTLGFTVLKTTSNAYCPLQYCLKGWQKMYDLCTMETDRHNECNISNCGRSINDMLQHIQEEKINIP